MDLSELLAAQVKAAVHAALDEREAHAWPQLLTLKQIEERYRDGNDKPVKASTLRAHILSGDLEAVKPGKEYLVSPEALRAWLERQAINKPVSGETPPKDARISRT